MSSPAAATAHDHPTEQNKFQIFVEVAMLLAVITGMEIITVYLPFPHALLFWALVTMSAVKFLFVIFIFMHLHWDKLFCTVLFFIGLVLGGGTMWALLKLFGAAVSIPLSAS